MALLQRVVRKVYARAAGWYGRSRRLRYLLLSLPLIVSACALAPPVQEMSDARQAIRAAREVHAEQHAPALLHSAERYLQQATEELDVGHYHEAREAALSAKEQAIEARDKALHAEPR